MCRRLALPQVARKRPRSSRCLLESFLLNHLAGLRRNHPAGALSMNGRQDYQPLQGRILGISDSPGIDQLLNLPELPSPCRYKSRLHPLASLTLRQRLRHFLLRDSEPVTVLMTPQDFLQDQRLRQCVEVDFPPLETFHRRWTRLLK
jgi:hypothetical protein